MMNLLQKLFPYPNFSCYETDNMFFKSTNLKNQWQFIF
jgi:hypothetical protein